MPENAPAEIFDDLADDYDALIDWPKRLAHEAPFYRRLFRQVEARRVLDVACGSGHHAAMFHSWGLHVEGADISPVMLQRARASFGESDSLNWVQRSFDQPAQPPASFDVAICVGNSLAITPDLQAVKNVLRAMALSIKPAGAIVVQLLNLWRLAEGPTLWQKCKRIQDEHGDRILLKGVHRCGDLAYVDVVSLAIDGGTVASRSRSVTMQAIRPASLVAAAKRAQIAGLEFYGDYQATPYRREESVDLILVGRCDVHARRIRGARRAPRARQEIVP